MIYIINPSKHHIRSICSLFYELSMIPKCLNMFTCWNSWSIIVKFLSIYNKNNNNLVTVFVRSVFIFSINTKYFISKKNFQVDWNSRFLFLASKTIYNLRIIPILIHFNRCGPWETIGLLIILFPPPRISSFFWWGASSFLLPGTCSHFTFV